MTGKGASMMLALMLVALVVGVAWWGFRHRTSPGALHPSHASVGALRGNRGCDACHGTGEIVARAPFAGACNECHVEIARSMEGGTGLHGSLAPEVRASCEACHHEHVGDLAPLVSAAAFLRAGVEKFEEYDHRHAESWGLHGAHASLGCVACHALAETPTLPEGSERFLGLAQACTGCHEDAHQGELGSDCASCHGQERPFREAALFAHPETFPLTRGHAGLACTDCHADARNFTGQSTACVSCHQGTFDATTRPAHALAGLATGCLDCHTTQGWTPAEFEHGAGFALVGAHAGLACTACHAPGGPQGEVEAFHGTRSCAACHASPHEARFVSAAARSRPGSGDGCVVCHQAADAGWNLATPRVTPALHLATGFPLARPHDARACVECHPGIRRGSATPWAEEDWRQSFPGREASACEACHDDPHAGQFRESVSGGACASCHLATSFHPTSFDGEMHAAAGFALDGLHRAVACALCHKEVEGVRRFAGTGGACASCHEDVHEGTFDEPGKPRAVRGQEGCARCHTTRGFREVSWTPADHKLWTGEELLGKHGEASCNDCHRRAGGVIDPGAAFARAPRACVECHQDIHAGQFRERGRVDCARCHAGTRSFRELRFDHQRDSRFALDADHAGLACSACHRAVRVGEGEVVRYKPLGTACADCHDPRSDAARRGGGER